MFKFFTNLFKKSPKKDDDIQQRIDEAERLYPELNDEIEAKEPFMSVEVEEGDRLEDITRKWEEKYPDQPIDKVLGKPVQEPTDKLVIQEEQVIEVTPITGAVNKKKRRKGGGYSYIRIHSNLNAFKLHLSELEGRGAVIIVEGMKITWYYE